jgi:ankyrin repeat protein
MAVFQRLLTAVCCKPISTITKLLSDPANFEYINHVSTKGTLLHYAVFHQKFDIAEYLIGIGADINKASSSGETPLSWAIKTKNIDFIRYLLSRGAVVSEKDMFEAVLTTIPNIVRIIHEAGGNLNANDMYGAYRTPLHTAISKLGRMENSIDVEPVYEIIMYLLDNGVSIPLLESVDEIFYSFVDRIAPTHNNPHIISIFNKFMENGLNVNKLYRVGAPHETITLVHNARNPIIVKCILNAGFTKFEHKSPRGYTPLFWAIKRQWPIEVIKLFLKYGANPYVSNNERTLFEYIKIKINNSPNNIDLVRYNKHILKVLTKYVKRSLFDRSIELVFYRGNAI